MWINLVSARSASSGVDPRALQASAKNAAQLAQLQREHASLQETTAKQTHQLAIARDQTLRLEEEVRAANLEVDAADYHDHQ